VTINCTTGSFDPHASVAIGLLSAKILAAFVAASISITFCAADAGRDHTGPTVSTMFTTRWIGLFAKPAVFVTL